MPVFPTFNGTSITEVITYNNTITDGFFVIGMILAFVVVLALGMKAVSKSDDALTPFAVSFFIGTILSWLSTTQGWVSPEISTTMVAGCVVLSIMMHMNRGGGSNV